MKKPLLAALSLAAAAAVALPSQSAQAADCSDDAETILNLAETGSGFIPVVGDIASAGLSIFGALVCDEQQPLDTDAVVALVLTELDENAARIFPRDLRRAQRFMGDLASDLQDAGAGVRFDNADAAFVDEILDTAKGIEEEIFDMERPFFGAMTSRNNARVLYDLGPALLLANYKLTLAQVAAGLSQDREVREFVDLIASTIVADFAAYQEESDRVRGVEIVMVRKSTLSRAELHRSGKKMGISFQEDYPIWLTEKHRKRFDEDARSDLEREFVRPLQKSLNAQERRVAVVMARARALLEDPFVSLSSVEVPHKPVVFLENQATDRCLFHLGGHLRTDDTLRNGLTRTRVCDRLVSMQEWRLEDSGHIRSSSANLCLTALDDRSLVETRPCDPNNDRQVWTRSGDQFQVTVGDTTTCLSTRPGASFRPDIAMRHLACDPDDSRQDWRVFGGRSNL